MKDVRVTNPFHKKLGGTRSGDRNRKGGVFLIGDFRGKYVNPILIGSHRLHKLTY